MMAPTVQGNNHLRKTGKADAGRFWYSASCFQVDKAVGVASLHNSYCTYHSDMVSLTVALLFLWQSPR